MTTAFDSNILTILGRIAERLAKRFDPEHALTGSKSLKHKNVAIVYRDEQEQVALLFKTELRGLDFSAFTISCAGNNEKDVLIALNAKARGAWAIVVIDPGPNAPDAFIDGVHAFAKRNQGIVVLVAQDAPRNHAVLDLFVPVKYDMAKREVAELPRRIMDSSLARLQLYTVLGPFAMRTVVAGLLVIIAVVGASTWLLGRRLVVSSMEDIATTDTAVVAIKERGSSTASSLRVLVSSDSLQTSSDEHHLQLSTCRLTSDGLLTVKLRRVDFIDKHVAVDHVWCAKCPNRDLYTSETEYVARTRNDMLQGLGVDVAHSGDIESSLRSCLSRWIADNHQGGPAPTFAVYEILGAVTTPIDVTIDRPGLLAKLVKMADSRWYLFASVGTQVTVRQGSSAVSLTADRQCHVPRSRLCAIDRRSIPQASSGTD